ncbi:MAG: histidine kinase [Lachnospiraceae bacterium]|nr:histidine kinase [Lachnospiraceae bacterium]
MKASKYTSIRFKILYISCIFTLIIGIVITCVSYILFQKNYYKNLTNSINTNLTYLSEHIDSEMSSIDQLATYCHSSSVITSYVESSLESTPKRLNAYNVLSEYRQNNLYSKYLYRIVITSNAGSFIQSIASEYSSVADIARELPKQPFYEELQSSPMDYSYGFITDPFYTARSNSVLPLLKPITYKFKNDVGGYIFLEISSKLFADAIQSYGNDLPGQLVLTLGSHHYLYEDKSFHEISDFGDCIAITHPLRHSGCSVTHMMKKSQTLADISAFFPLAGFTFAILVAITMILNSLLDRTITRPVHEIQNRLSKIASGDFSRDKSIEWDHELGDIGKKVNDLAENIKLLLDSELKSEKEKQDLEYKVLQSQVNPHFLYNTLNSIKWMAVTQGATGISEMTTALARLLKSISKGTRLLIPLKDELSLLQDYFTIQQYRYGGTLHINIDIPDKLKEYLIVKFTLQPIVENAIFHGIEPTGREGNIDININEYGENDLEISVRDNGVGMSDELIEQVLSGEESSGSEFFREFGIINIQKRLQHEYGKGYGIKIDSVVGEYTTMTVKIPKQK